MFSLSFYREAPAWLPIAQTFLPQKPRSSDLENSPEPLRVYQVLPRSDSLITPALISHLHPFAVLCSGPSPGPRTGGGSCQPNPSPAQRHKGRTDPPHPVRPHRGLVVCALPPVQPHPDLTGRQAPRLCRVPRGYVHAHFGAQSPAAAPELVLNLALIQPG